MNAATKLVAGLAFAMLACSDSSPIAPPLSESRNAIENQRQWDAAFKSRYGDSRPLLDIMRANEAGEFAWQAHYWIRAYVSMAQASGETKYLDDAVALIDFVLSYRDDARQARGEIDLLSQPYFIAPLYYLNHRNQAAPGWRVFAFDREWRVQTLDDGQITQAIMRFADLTFSDERFLAYQTVAAAYIARVEETVNAHNSLFVMNRFDDVPGSYYYPNPNGTGLYTGAVPFNHSATMGATLLLLDKVKGGVPEYRSKAEALLAYFKQHLRPAINNAYDWDYHLHDPLVISDAGSSDQDLNHAHVDLGFLVLAYHCGLSLSRQEMERFASTLTNNIYRGNGELAWSVNGIASDSKKRYWSVAFNWIDLAEFDHQVFDIAREVYRKHYATPTWAQPFLGWAEILRWTLSREKQ